MLTSSSLLNTEKAASRLGLATSTLEKWRFQGIGPTFVKLGRCVRYRSDDLDIFIQYQSRKNTAKNQ